MDYESVDDAMEGICSHFEQHLKEQMSEDAPSISYSISQLFDYIDQATDLVCLVYQRSEESYAPKAKDWIKEKLYVFFREQDTQKSNPAPN
uniref:Enhancer of rudimentary homolog n=2 Tax=Tetranychus urticae TaxID=32264 RepID=T1KR51_TETUR